MEGELKFFLELQVKQTPQGVFLSQTKFAKDLVSKFVLQESKPNETPISTSDKITKDSRGADIDPTYYRSIIGSLLYLTTSRPDISFSVGTCARYQAAPKESHIKATKRIIQYVHGTSNFGLWYSYDTITEIVKYSNADWAGDVEDRKNTSGGYFYIGNSLVFWHSKKQNSISLSITEAEYITARSACTQLL